MFVTTGGHFRAREGPLARSAMLTGRVQQPRTRVPPDTLDPYLATWRSGYAAACKAVYTGSIPVVAFGTGLSCVLNLRAAGWFERRRPARCRVDRATGTAHA